MNDIQKQIYTYYNQVPAKENPGNSLKGVEMSNQIKSLIESLNNAENRSEMAQIFADAVERGEIEKLDPITYRSGNYIIRDVLTYAGEKESQFLKELTKKGISIAPQFVDSVTKGDYTTIVTRIDGMDGEDLIPFSQGYNLLDDAAKRKAFQDVKKLVQANLINQAIFTRGNAAICITPKTKQIVIPSWSMLRPIENNEKQSILNDCYNIFFKQ